MSEWTAGQLVERRGEWIVLADWHPHGWNVLGLGDCLYLYPDGDGTVWVDNDAGNYSLSDKCKLLLPACTLDTAWDALKSVFGEGREYCTQTSSAYIDKRIFLAGDEAQYYFERDRFTPAIRFRLNLRVYLAGTDPTAADMFARTHLDRAAAIREWLRGVTQRSKT